MQKKLSSLMALFKNLISPRKTDELQQAQLLAENDVILCSNCNAQLKGNFCHKCGQSSRNMIKFFGEIVKELLGDIVGYDSRLKHSLLPLFLRPGRLTLEYIKGRRFHYVMPFRFYLFTSLLFILALQLKTQSSIPYDIFGSNNKESIGEISQIIKQDLAEELTGTSEANHAAETEKNSDQDKKDSAVSDGIEFNLEDEGFLKQIGDEIKSKANAWKEDPRPLIDELFRLLPYMMFVLLPIFALFLKFIYLFSKRYYVEHLVFCLHNHCFLYLALLTEMGLAYAESALVKTQHWLAEYLLILVDWSALLLGWWIAIYLILSVKRVYQQSWSMTLGKSFLMALGYVCLLTTGLVVTVVIGAYMA